MTDHAQYNLPSNVAITLQPIQYPMAADNPAMVYLSSLASNGRRAIQGRLKHVADMFGYPVESMPWASMRYQHLAAIREQLQESGLAPSTINLTLYALRGIARNAFNLGIMPADDYERIKNISPVRGSRVTKGRALPTGEIAALLDTCGNDTKGVRDAAIICNHVRLWVETG